MIVLDQKNLKVHHAGVEHITHLGAVYAAGIHYMLFTAFNLIADRAGIKSILVSPGVALTEIPQLIHKHARHTIMDSGLFTLMFGALQGRKDAKMIERWQDNLIDFIGESGYQGVCVEVDCQKVLSPQHAWKFREKMRRSVSNRLINVFHLEDTQKGLDRLIEWSDYVAISVPELRRCGKTEHTKRIANYIKNRKPEIDIHLLGCTELKLLRELHFCTSSDSSTWTECTRFGKLRTELGTVHINQFKQSSLAAPYRRRVRAVFKQLGIQSSNEEKEAVLAFACEQYRALYTKAAGDQF